MNLVSIIIPYAPYHTSIVEQAIAAADSQSLPCHVIPISDYQNRGAGWARNAGVALSDAVFIAFCDADDTLREDAIERMVASYQRGKYVYSDDQQGDSIHQTPDCGAYLDGTWHTVNALIPTAAFKAVGGFDETLPALEDLDLFLRLQAAGVCGVRCPHVLVRYTAGGKRSRDIQQRDDYVQFKQSIYQRYSGAAKTMCACGGAPISGEIPDGKQDADILATALYTPRAMPGPVTGRMYAKPRGPSGYQLWIDPLDIDSPTGKTLWSPVKTIDPGSLPAVEDVMRMAQEAMRGA